MPISLNGLLVIDKPSRITSHDVVQRVRRALHVKQVGHTGTLDPMATGVLVICVGVATRVSEYLLGHDKAYRATIRLGIETDTYDATGEVVSTQPVNVEREALEAALAQFVGATQQTPPMHSAIKRDGQKLYELARAGIEVERESRAVIMHTIDLIDYQSPDVTIDVRSSAGTYIRSLAHDLGAVLGTGAHLIALRRTVVGPFGLDQAIGLAEFEAAARDGQGLLHLRSLDEALYDWPKVIVNATQRQRAVTGGRIEALDLIGTRCRAYDERGELIALLTFDQKKHWWRAEKVLTTNLDQ